MPERKISDSGSQPVLVERRVPARIVRMWPLPLVSIAFVHGLWVSWLKWGNVLIDGGREMEMPRRLLEGEGLYVDVRNMYGPLAPYVNMVLYWVFGVHLDVLIWAGVTSAALMTLALYLLARRFAGRAPATLLAVVFLYASAFAHLVGNPSFNFVIPYAYAATYGILVATLSLYFLVRHLQDGGTRDLLVSALFLALAALTKVDVLLPAAAAHGIAFIGWGWSRSLGRRHALAYGGAALLVAGCYGALAVRAGAGLWSDNMGSLANDAMHTYVLRTMGLEEPGRSLVEAALSAAILAGAVGAGAGAAWLARLDRRSLAAKVVFVTLAAAGVCAAYAYIPTTLSLRLIPLVTAAALGVFIWRWVSRPDARARILPDLVLWVFVAGCLARILLRTIPHHYGFFLTPIPIVGVGVVLFRYLPDAWGRSSSAALGCASAAAGALAGVALACFMASDRFYAMHRVPLDTPRGRLLLLPGAFEPGAVAFMSRLPPGTRVATIPQGAGLVFLSGLQMADGTFTYLPMEMSGRYDDEHVVERWQARPPDVIFFLRQNMAEFGFQGFGIDYGLRTFAFIRENYEPMTDASAFAVFLRYSPRAGRESGR